MISSLQTLDASTSTDSLYNAWNHEKDPTLKFDIGQKLLWKYIHSDLDEATRFSDTLLIFGQQRGGEDNWEALYIKAEILRRKGNDDEAIKIFLLLESQAIKNQWDDSLPRVWNSLAFLFEGLKKWEEAISYFKKSANIYSGNNAMSHVMALSNLADVYLTKGDTLIARDINLKMLEITEREFSPKVLSHVLEWSKELDQRFSGSCLYSIEQLNQILDYAYKTNSLMTALHFFISKMECLYEKENYQQLIAFGESVQVDFESYEDLHMNMKFLTLMKIAYVHQSQWKKSYKILEKRDSLEFILFNQEKKESITQDQLKYHKLQNEKLEQEAESALREKEQANYLNLILIFLVISSLLIFFLYWKQREIREKLEKEQLEHQIWQLQFNPHFFFNALTSIQATLYEGKPANAIKAINRLATMFRQTLSRSQLEWTDLNSELEFLEEYITIHKFMSGDEFEFEVNKSIKETNIQVPPFLLQPIVENAIKHGFRGNENKGNKLVVELYKKGSEIKTNIRNNGNKFKINIGMRSSSVGLKITDKRLLSYEQNHKGIRIQNNLRNNENWVEVSFSLPFRIDE